MANREKITLFHSPFATRYSPRFSIRIRYSPLPLFQHPVANQRFHMPDIRVADFVGDRPDARRPRHRMPTEKQMVAGADQAGVEQYRIDFAEFAGPDALLEQSAMEIQ